MPDRDAQVLADAIKTDFAGHQPHSTDVDRAPPPVRVIDCVLSLRRPYKTVVEPRVLRFLRSHPEVRRCEQLRDMMRAEGPASFLEHHLDMRFPQRAEILLAVVERLLEILPGMEGTSELDRLERWARAARPHDYLGFGVKGFGVAGYQYLRLLFGANTSKPDIHIQRYVARILGRDLSDMDSLLALEQAATLAGISLRAIDSGIWLRGTGQHG